MNPLLNFVNDPMTVLGLNVLNSNNRPAQGLLQGLNQNAALAQNRANLLQDELQRQQMQAQIIRAQQIEDARRRYFQPSVTAQEGLYGLGAAGDIPGASLQAQMLPKPPTPPSIVQTASYLYAPGSKEWTQFIHDATLKPLVDINNRQPLTPEEASRLVNPATNKPYAYGVTPAGATGATIVNTPTAEEAMKMSQSDISNRMLDDLESLMNGKAKDSQGNYMKAPEVGPVAGAKYDLTLNPYTGPLMPGGGLYGKGLSPNEARLISLTQSLSNQLLQAMRGQQVGPAEQLMFNKQLPVYGQQKELFMENLRLTRQNLEDLSSGRKKYRNIPQLETQPEKTQEPSISNEKYPVPPGFTIPQP